MKVFGRFLYAMLAVGIFLLAFEFGLTQMRSKYYHEVFGESLTDETSELPEFYYFYASMPDYHNQKPIIDINHSGFKIRGYEIARTFIEEDDSLRIEEYIFFLVYHDETEKLNDIDKIRLSNGNVEDYFEIHLISYQGLNILASVDYDTSFFLVNKKDIDLTKNYDQLLLLDKNAVSIIESALTLNVSDFIIKSSVEIFYSEFNKLPTEETMHHLNNVDIQPKEQIISNNNYVVSNYGYILGIAMGIYFLVLIFSTYFIFFKKRKDKNLPYKKETEYENI